MGDLFLREPAVMIFWQLWGSCASLPPLVSTISFRVHWLQGGKNHERAALEILLKQEGIRTWFRMFFLSNRVKSKRVSKQGGWMQIKNSKLHVEYRVTATMAHTLLASQFQNYGQVA